MVASSRREIRDSGRVVFLPILQFCTLNKLHHSRHELHTVRRIALFACGCVVEKIETPPHTHTHTQPRARAIDRSTGRANVLVEKLKSVFRGSPGALFFLHWPCAEQQDTGPAADV